MDRLGFDQVIVIEDEDDPVGEGGDLVDQRGQDGLGRRRLRGLKRAQRSFPDVADRFLSGLDPSLRQDSPSSRTFRPRSGKRPQGSDHVGQEAGRVVVALVEREPGDLGRIAMRPYLCPSRWTHSLTSVVLPKPAGAEMRVSLRSTPIRCSPRSAARSGAGARPARAGRAEYTASSAGADPAA